MGFERTISEGASTAKMDGLGAPTIREPEATLRSAPERSFGTTPKMGSMLPAPAPAAQTAPALPIAGFGAEPRGSAGFGAEPRGIESRVAPQKPPSAWKRPLVVQPAHPSLPSSDRPSPPAHA